MNDMRDHLIIGVIGRDPEINQRNGQNGPYDEVSFSLAVARSFGDKTDWYNCRLAGKRAQVIKDYFHKGNSIYVFGHEESYKKDGDKTVHWIFKVSDFSFPTITKKDVDDYNARMRSRGEHTTPSTEQETPDDFEQIDVDVPF